MTESFNTKFKLCAKHINSALGTHALILDYKPEYWTLIDAAQFSCTIHRPLSYSSCIPIFPKVVIVSFSKLSASWPLILKNPKTNSIISISLLSSLLISK